MNQTDKAEIRKRALDHVVSKRLDLQWETFAKSHPDLAAALERSTLVDTTTRRLMEDPELQQALDMADQDEAVLQTATRVVELVDRWVGRLLGL